jgi:hypothetical protein
MPEINKPKYKNYLLVMIFCDFLILLFGGIYQSYIKWIFLFVGIFFWMLFFFYDVKLTNTFPQYRIEEANRFFGPLIKKIGIRKAAIIYFCIEIVSILVGSLVIFLAHTALPDIIPSNNNIVAIFFISIMIMGDTHLFACIFNLRLISYQRLQSKQS